MKNPCNKCIVSSMCKNKCCDELAKYIESLSDIGAMLWNWNVIGLWFRQGKIIFYADGRKNWWRMRRDGESMYSVYCQSDM